MLAADLQSAAWPPDYKSGGSKKVGKNFEELLSRSATVIGCSFRSFVFYSNWIGYNQLISSALARADVIRHANPSELISTHYRLEEESLA